MLDPTPKREARDIFPSIVVAATTIVGLLSLAVAFGGPREPNGLGLIASALAFGLLANAVLRR